MRNGLIERIFGLEKLVNIISQIKLPTEAKPGYTGQKRVTGTLRGIPEVDKPLIKELMAQLSDESNPSGRISADGDIKILLHYYGEMGVDAGEVRAEYLLRKVGLPYIR